MAIGYYIIPMVAGPYSRENPQRPDYVNEIRCNWTGHNVDEMGIYICKVNTTDAKHTDLMSRTGVQRLPAEYTWDTVIADMHVAARNYIANSVCAAFDIPYDETETIGELLMRVINTGLFSLQGLELDTQFYELPISSQNKILNLCDKWGIPINDTDTIRDITDRAGPHFWDGGKLQVSEY